MAKKQKYYVVWKGKRPGIYRSWEACKSSIAGIKGAQFKSFATLQEAKQAYEGNYEDYKSNKNPQKASVPGYHDEKGYPNYHSISVDAAVSGNPGKMEYQGVDTKTKRVLFKQGPFPEGTNNIGEFLALVHGLAFLKERQSDRLIYTDSRTAMAWVRKKKCNSTLRPNAGNKELLALVARAEKWLHNNTYNTPIVKWETKAWGEIPADFGRK